MHRCCLFRQRSRADMSCCAAQPVQELTCYQRAALADVYAATIIEEGFQQHVAAQPGTADHISAADEQHRCSYLCRLSA
jgi:hypothetical protein